MLRHFKEKNEVKILENKIYKKIGGEITEKRI